MSITPTSREPLTRGASEAAATPLTQFQLGQYFLVEKIGEGGMGHVYKARHSKLKKLVALKILPAERMGLPDMVQRFHQEMEAIGRLEHPNIVRATDAGQDQGTYFLVMEYVEGQDLLKLLKRTGPLPVDEACALIRQAALGLQYIGEKGLVHRDIKPSNLLLSTQGQVKILDLGLALLKKRTTPEEELTSPGQVMGTWDYMAPEQTQDSHAVDIRADIYSLGCTLFKLLTGQAPFAGESFSSYAAKARAHREVPTPAVNTLRPGVPEPVLQILERMLAKRPEDRFQKPADVAQALEAFASKRELSLILPPSDDRAAPGSTAKVALLPVPQAGAAPAAVRWQRRSLALGLAGLAASLVVVFLLWRPFEQTADDTDAKKDTGAKENPLLPGKWRSVMGQPPKKLYWSENLPPPAWHPERDELLVASAGDRGILGLADVPGGVGYRFQITVRQKPWNGKFGIVFGFREQAGDPTMRYQSIALHPIPNDPTTFLLDRSVTEVTTTPKGRRQFTSTLLERQPVARPSRHEEVLEIEVHHVLHNVRWAGQDVKSLCTREVNAKLKPEDYAGALGVININNMALYRDGRLMILER